MKHKYILLVVLNFFLLQNSFTQNGSGYMGKKFAIGYGNIIGVKYFGARMHNNLSLDYFATNTINIRLSGLYDKFTFPSDYRFLYKIDNQNENQTIDLMEYGNLDNQAIGVGVALFFYPTSYIGPVGAYHKLEFQYYHFSSKTKFKESVPAIYSDFNEPEKYTGKATYLSYGFGKRYVLYDRLLLSLGGEIGLNFHYFSGFLNEEPFVFDFYKDEDMNIVYDNMINYYYNNTMFIRLNLGIAYLL